jgi:hypothetical protein
MQISSGWLAQITAKVRAMFMCDVAPAEIVTEPPPIIGLPDITTQPAAEVQLMRRQSPRLLAARIACQAKLNVPVGRKPRVAALVSAKTTTRRPKKAFEVKTTTNVRSVYLPARHLAATTRPKPRSNVIVLPLAAKIAKPQARAVTAKVLRLAA